MAKEAQRCADKLIGAQKDRDAVTKDAAARESAAGLTGQVKTLQAQNAKLMEAIGGKGR
ncbi:hypothetical protein PA01_18305 [Azoarcus sp. PA01]|nr:hypothetical protein PA01_19435 [Azoarcus sp. PA01]KAI5913735.1 hypothetical protein PA01_18305 [Azoarcus sp. PA01]